MLIHLHLSEPPGYGIKADCLGCETPLPVGIFAFRQRWHVGQVCLRCRRAGWTLGTYDTPAAAQRALANFVRAGLDSI